MAAIYNARDQGASESTEKRLASFTFDMAREFNGANPYKSWAHSKEEGFSAKDRFSNDFFYVATQPKFTLPKSAKVFTIGSCFARNIERELSASGIGVLTDKMRIPTDLYDTNADPRAAMNKFNIPSILDDINRAFDPNNDLLAGLIPAGDDLWFDPATTSIRMLTLDEARLVRTTVRDTFARIAEADLIIFTLGLVEMWRDRFSGLYLNTHPNPKAVRHDQARRWHLKKDYEAGKIGRERFEAEWESRFEFIRPGYQFLSEQMHAVIKQCSTAAPTAKIVVTVSPVPLQTTMLPDDVVCSSTLSKSILRAIAEEMREAYEFVDYFPSYEMVTNSPRDTSWLEDRVHVHPDTVAKVTSTFVREWFDGEV